MLKITISLILLHLSSIRCGTRLPLEVFEIHQSSQIVGSQTAATTATQHQQVYNSDIDYHKHSPEYILVHQPSSSPSLSSSSSSSSSSTPLMIKTTTRTAVKITSTTAPTASNNNSNQLDRRRSRQMLEIMQPQQQLQQQHQQYRSHKPHDNRKETRILYQIGESEDDLPICAPNEVCSKIDLYETPWIERQCRCPDLNRYPNIILHHNKELLHDNGNYHSYYEKENLVPNHNKRTLVGDYQDKKFESVHLKKLMQKLGAVYQEDLSLETNDFIFDNDGNSHDRMYHDINGNEFPSTMMQRYDYKPITAKTMMSKAHMRHSGHSGHKPKEYPLIGGCPSSLGIEDGHTIADKTRHYKLCNPVHKLPVCKHFRDFTWTLMTSSEINVTKQIVHCRCPKNSVTYLTKREPPTDGSTSYTYLFACSPLTRIRCQRKEPCKLFTVRKRQEFLDEVNINSLCQCPKGHHCPSHHMTAGVIPGETYIEDNIQTYSGYCMAND